MVAGLAFVEVAEGLDKMKTSCVTVLASSAAEGNLDEQFDNAHLRCTDGIMVSLHDSRAPYADLAVLYAVRHTGPPFISIIPGGIELHGIGYFPLTAQPFLASKWWIQVDGPAAVDWWGLHVDQLDVWPSKEGDLRQHADLSKCRIYQDVVIRIENGVAIARSVAGDTVAVMELTEVVRPFALLVNVANFQVFGELKEPVESQGLGRWVITPRIGSDVVVIRQTPGITFVRTRGTVSGIS